MSRIDAIKDRLGMSDELFNHHITSSLVYISDNIDQISCSFKYRLLSCKASFKDLVLSHSEVDYEDIYLKEVVEVAYDIINTLTLDRDKCIRDLSNTKAELDALKNKLREMNNILLGQEHGS